jgi:hypothetical protein
MRRREFRLLASAIASTLWCNRFLAASIQDAIDPKASFWGPRHSINLVVTSLSFSPGRTGKTECASIT